MAELFSSVPLWVWLALFGTVGLWVIGEEFG